MGICRRLGKERFFVTNFSHIPSQAKSAIHQDMIRERVSTQGIIRPLEPESELPAMQVPPEQIGTLSEHAIRRYATGHARFAKKFARAIRHIEKQRSRNIDRARRDTDQHIAALQHYLDREETGAVLDPSWTLSWALDADERPPPSSIVARRDTAEALKLARVADKAVLASERALSANNLWRVIVGFLTASPDDHPRTRGNKVHLVGARTGKTARMGSFVRRKRDSAGDERPSAQNDDGSPSRENGAGAQTGRTARLGSFFRRKRQSVGTPSGSARSSLEQG